MFDLIPQVRRGFVPEADREYRMMHRLVRLTHLFLFLSTAAVQLTAGLASADEPLATGEINIYGNHKTKRYIIRREIPLRTGEPFDQKKLALARRRIRQLPGIDFSEIRVTYTPADSALSLKVTVTEKSALHGYPMVQRGLENLFSLGLWVSQDNFRGRSETLRASALINAGTVIDAGWENAWLGSGPRIGIGLYGTYLNYKYVYDDLGGEFDGAPIEQYGGDFSLFYTFWSGFRVLAEAGYRAVNSSQEGVTNEEGGDRFPVYTLGVRYDGRSSTLFPWSGWYITAGGSAVGPGEEAYSIVRGRADVRWFLPLFDRTVFALQVRPRVNDGDRIPVYMREHIGGGMTIRSYDYGEFNAVSSIVTGAEYRIPINFDRRHSVEEKLLAASIHLFFDAGAVWELDQSPEDGDLWHEGFGLGIILLNAWFKGMRIDYGWNMDSNGRFHLEFGTRF